MGFSALEKVGLISLAVLGSIAVNKIFWYIYRNFLGPRAKNLDFKSLGQWALITGSTDGLGKAYAETLASKGCDVILVSRTEEKLKSIAAEIEAKHNVRTKIIVADFTHSSGLYEHIEKQITGLEIGILVNNVGVSFAYPEYFLDVPDKETMYDNIIKANIVSVTKMCALVMPGMVERRRGMVINISSAAALMPSPLLAVYAASKLYVDKLTEDLASSYERKGLLIQSVLPGPVATKMTKMRKPTWMAPSAKDFVRSALGSTRRARHTTGYGPHDLLMMVMCSIEAVCPPFAEWLAMKTTENIRARALKKVAPAAS